MASFRFPDGSWPRPIKEVAASICCICGTTSANQVEYMYHASGHYRGGLEENTSSSLRCRLVPCAFLVTSKQEFANHILGHEEMNLLNNDGSVDRLFALLRSAQPTPQPSPPPPTRPEKQSQCLSLCLPKDPRKSPPKGLWLSPPKGLRTSAPKGPRLSPPKGPRLNSPESPLISLPPSPLPSPLKGLEGPRMGLQGSSQEASSPSPVPSLFPTLPPPASSTKPSSPSPSRNLSSPIPMLQSVTLEVELQGAPEGSPKRRSLGSGSPGELSPSSPASASRTPQTPPQVLPQPEHSLLKKSAIPISEPPRAASPEFPSPNPMFVPVVTKEPRSDVTTPSQLHRMTRDTFTTILPFKKRMLTVASGSSPVGTGVYATYTETPSSKEFKWWEKVISARSLDESPQPKASPKESRWLPTDSKTSGSRKRKQQRYPESTSY